MGSNLLISHFNIIPSLLWYYDSENCFNLNLSVSSVISYIMYVMQKQKNNNNNNNEDK